MASESGPEVLPRPTPRSHNPIESRVGPAADSDLIARSGAGASIHCFWYWLLANMLSAEPFGVE